MKAAIECKPGVKALILGPCSAESEAQMRQVALEIREMRPDFIRAGLWKPRTRPGHFEGMGERAIPWMQQIQREFGLKICTEVANARHVEAVLKAGFDAVWIGARTSVNPFYVGEIAEALSGVDIPVMVKNPINPDVHLWQGAIERVLRAGIEHVAAIHRGFSFYGNAVYRNVPRWQIPIELKRRLPDLQMIADISHIGGRPEYLLEIAQIAYDLNFDGLMAELHPDPTQARSDADQQVTPAYFRDQILSQLVERRASSEDCEFNTAVEKIRVGIDQVDSEILRLISHRMELAEQIGRVKKKFGVSIFQPPRWEEIVQRLLEDGRELVLSEEFIFSLIEAIHIESIQRQSKQMNVADKGD
ncbi:MAG: bifunctional 3-deoxy-7-phosphoheptulonate synthase/chorismate mutase type II [Saprospiraceae bacterium]|nr:bifunctional 3-deoxy-7-phosphoheptulonate synthase/chorismate mutase type II [Saprospiraceae bacterium]